jgi:deaminated glutathione amidase
MQSFRASAIQMSAGPDKEANLAMAGELVAAAAAAGADLVALPEVFAWRGPQEREPEMAEPLAGRIGTFASALARRLGIWLVAGSILESDDAASGGRKCFNTTALFSRDGTLAASYRKIHLFDVDVEGRIQVRESKTRLAGGEPCCIDTELGRIGIAICYDLRFPELFRELAAAGAEIMVLPSAFTAPTGRAHWHTLVRARAIENQCYFLAPNQFGASAMGFENYGHSLIVDPWGEVLADGGPGGPCVVTAELSAGLLTRVRSELPALSHRRLGN